MPVDEWKQLRSTLRANGIDGAEDVGRSVNSTRDPSTLDERAAMPVLLEALPGLADPSLVEAVAGHLRRPWARPEAFEPLHRAFLHWAAVDQNTAWTLGDTLGMVAASHHLETLLTLCRDPSLGTARQMVVYSLRRYKDEPEVARVLGELVADPDVGPHAMSALRSVVGNEQVVPTLERVAFAHQGSGLGSAADRELRKARQALES